MSQLRSTKGRSGVRDPEIRFQRATRWGEPSDHRPDLGPCLIYLGADNGNGYGQFSYGGRNGYAHRYAWERENGPIPDGMTVDHLCRVRRCVNAKHMELTDRVDNYMRAVAIREKCPNGHKYTGAQKSGKRQCRECQRDSWRRLEEKRKAERRKHGNRRIKYDQDLVRSVIADIRGARTTIATGARLIGCNPGYLGRRVWEEVKDAVFARDKRCIVCGTDQNLDAHHRVARGSGGASRPEIAFGMANLVTLCRMDHMSVEAHPNDAREAGLRVDRGVDPATVPVQYLGGLALLDDEGFMRFVEVEAS